MAHPKHKISKSRRDKRRTHDKAVSLPISIDNNTGMPHIWHRAHWHDGKLMYKGRVVYEKAQA